MNVPENEGVRDDPAAGRLYREDQVGALDDAVAEPDRHHARDARDADLGLQAGCGFAGPQCPCAHQRGVNRTAGGDRRAGAFRAPYRLLEDVGEPRLGAESAIASSTTRRGAASTVRAFGPVLGAARLPLILVASPVSPRS